MPLLNNVCLTRSARRRLLRISVDGLFWSYCQIRWAQKIGDAAALSRALTAKKEYERNIALAMERRRPHV